MAKQKYWDGSQWVQVAPSVQEFDAHKAENATDAHNATSISVADTANKFTATNVETALLELFTFANNGKTDVASVVGSPATSGDTFTQLKTHIQNSKNTLATNLTNKDQSSVGTETLSALVAKVANVSTGKKFASGTATIASLSFDITVTGLSFRPSKVIVYRPTNGMFIVLDEQTISPTQFIHGQGPSAAMYTINATYSTKSDGFKLRFITNASGSQSANWAVIE